MAKVGQIRVLTPGEDAERLLACLRGKAEPYGVGVGPNEDGRVQTTDLGDSTDDLRAFISAQLDECATELRLRWSDFLSVP